MGFIVKHRNYRTMPEPYKEDGSIKWVVNGNSDLGKKRAAWWDKQIKILGANNRAEVARAIHPSELRGLKPCQICGKKLSILYIYPRKATLKKLNKLSLKKFYPFQEDITKIFDTLESESKELVFKVFKEVFDIPSSIKNEKNAILNFVYLDRENRLSPGVMSNAPDRFDGFHTYNACCRSKEDTGRHSSNLARYNQDRRAYENWAEGDWNLSNRLMSEFSRFKENVICPACGKKRKMSADHIGPISLGFTHRPKFNPLCSHCNSKKNNRITLRDVKVLLEDEKTGERVISWHSKSIWDLLKYNMDNEADTLALSKAMRLNLHNVLSLLSVIKEQGHIKFLKSLLRPEYSFFDYRFENFHPLRLNELTIIKRPLNNKNKHKNAERYIRISLDSLDKYKQKTNRRLKDLDNEVIKSEINSLLELLRANKNKEAYKKLLRLIELLSDETIARFFEKSKTF